MSDKQIINILLSSESEQTYFQLTEMLKFASTYTPKIIWKRSYEETINSLDQKIAHVCIFDDEFNSSDAFTFLSYLEAKNLNLPVIVISEGKSKDRDLRLLRAGAADYLIRDKIRPDFLYRAIAYAFERTCTAQTSKELQKDVMREQKLSSLVELAGNIAFELGKYLEEASDRLLSLEKSLNSETEKKNIKECKTLIGKSRKVIKNLLAFSPTEIKTIPCTDLTELIMDSTNFLNEATGNDIKVISLIDASSKITADINPSQIKQVLTNLVLNARDALPDGGTVKIRLTTPAHSKLPPRLQNIKQDYACIIVEDCGTGISKENQSRLFEPTFTTKSKKSKLGLGLPVAYSIIQAHQGWINVESAVNVGSKFSIYLPLAKEQHSKSDKKKRKGLVMVIEPDGTQSEICRLYFEAASLDTRIFNTTSDALSWFQHNFNRVDLVMLASVKHHSEDTLLQELKAINPKVKIVASGELTAQQAKTVIDKGILKIFPENNKYLSAITWVSEGLSL